MLCCGAPFFLLLRTRRRIVSAPRTAVKRAGLRTQLFSHMQSLKFSSLALSAALAAVVFASCKKDEDATPAGVGTVDIALEHKVGGADLDLTKSKAAYKTAAGDSFRVTKFTYYVSNVQLNKADGSSYKVPESYFLVNEANAATKHLTLAGIPVGDYNSLTFTIGVDSTRNVSGAQTGALSQSNGMFWMWSTGYIFLKLEGNYVQAGQATPGALSIHIGGFRKPYNAIRTVTTPVPNNGLIAVRPDHRPEVHMQADVLAMLSGPAPIRFGATGPAGTTQVTSVGMAGPEAVKVASNYARATNGMFSIEHVHAN